MSRKRLIHNLITELELFKGNKVRQQVSVPKWITRDLTYSTACLRGLVDTDGSIYDHSYRVNGKMYTYKKIDFTNKSQPLLDFVHTTLMQLGIKARYTRANGVRIESKESVKKYMAVVNSHNPKHLKRYQS